MQFRNPSPRGRGWQAGPRRWTAVAAAAVTAAVLVAVALAGVFSGSGRVTPIRAVSAALSRTPSARTGHAGPTARTGHPGSTARTGGHTAASQPAARTSCTSVAHIGDSTSVGMVDPAVLANPAQRLQAQYAQVGVRHVLVDASGGRSVVEALPGQVNGYDTALRMASHGFHGCWVIALGTNDIANVAAGSTASPAARIAEMMSVARGQPVLWVSARTLDTTGSWSEANMQAWNAALVRAAATYPNLRIFDWASVAQPGWYLPDGIHYTPAGYAARAHAIAAALARVFPAGGPGTSRIVR